MLSRFDTIPYTGTHTCEEIPPPSSQRLAAPKQSEPATDAVLAHKLYPNPNNGSFTVWLSLNEFDNAEIMVLNVDGRVVHRGSMSNGDNSLDLNVANGLYLYTIAINNELKWTGKIAVGMD